MALAHCTRATDSRLARRCSLPPLQHWTPNTSSATTIQLAVLLGVHDNDVNTDESLELVHFSEVQSKGDGSVQSNFKITCCIDAVTSLFCTTLSCTFASFGESVFCLKMTYIGLTRASSVEVIVGGSTCAQLASKVTYLHRSDRILGCTDKGNGLLCCFGRLRDIRLLFGRGRLTDDNQAA